MNSFFAKLRQRYAALPTEQRKRYTLLGVFGVVVIFLIIVASMKTDGAAIRKAKKDAATKDFILPKPDMAKESWLERGQRELDAQRNKLRALEETVKNFEKRIESLPQGGTEKAGPTVPGGGGNSDSAQEREAKLMSDLSKLGITRVERSGELYPLSPVQPAAQGDVKPKPFTADELGIARTPVDGTDKAAPQSARPVIEKDKGLSGPKNVMGVYDFSPKKVEAAPLAAPAPGTVGKDGTNYSETENFYTPGGSFLKVSLLTGLDAPTGPSASTQPHPVLLRIQDLSWLPNELRQNVTGCFIMAQSYGDLSVERAYIRGMNLSCVNKDNKKVLDEEIKGFTADTDGKLGMRGRVVSKQGQFLARALTAAFIEGIAKGFDTSVNTTVVTGGGVVTTNEIDGFGDGFKKGMSSGINKAASKLSEFYLKSAEQIFPIIEVNARRHATFVISEGKRFSFNKEIMIEQAKTKEMTDGRL